MAIINSDFFFNPDNYTDTTRKVGWYDGFKANLAYLNMPMVEWVQEQNKFGGIKRDENFNVVEEIPDEYLDVGEELLHAKNKEHLNYLIERVDKSRERREIAGNAPITSALTAGLVDPFNLILMAPPFSTIRFGKTAYQALKTGAVTGAGFGALSELRRAPFEIENTYGEISSNILFPAILGGGLGFAVKGGAPAIKRGIYSSISKANAWYKGQKFDLKDYGKKVAEPTMPKTKTDTPDTPYDVPPNFFNAPSAKILSMKLFNGKIIPKRVKESFYNMIYNGTPRKTGMFNDDGKLGVESAKYLADGQFYRYITKMEQFYREDINRKTLPQSANTFEEWFADTMKKQDFINSPSAPANLKKSAYDNATLGQRHASLFHKEEMQYFNDWAIDTGRFYSEKKFKQKIEFYENLQKKAQETYEKNLEILKKFESAGRTYTIGGKKLFAQTKKQRAAKEKYQNIVNRNNQILVNRAMQVKDLKLVLESIQAEGGRPLFQANFTRPIIYDKIKLQDKDTRKALLKVFDKSFMRARETNPFYSKKKLDINSVQKDSRKTMSRILGEDGEELIKDDLKVYIKSPTGLADASKIDVETADLPKLKKLAKKLDIEIDKKLDAKALAEDLRNKILDFTTRVFASKTISPSQKHFRHRKTNVYEWEVQDFIVNTPDSMHDYMQNMTRQLQFAENFDGRTPQEVIEDIVFELMEADFNADEIAEIVQAFRIDHERVNNLHRTNPTRIDNQIATGLKAGTSWTMLGGAGISALPDTGMVIAQHGFRKVGEAFKSIRDFDFITKFINKEMAGEIMQITSGAVQRAVVQDKLNTTNRTQLDKFVGTGNKIFYNLNLLAPATLVGRLMNGLIVSDKFVKLSKQWTNKTISEADKQFLTWYGFTEDMAQYVSQAPTEASIKSNLIYANTDAWDLNTVLSRKYKRKFEMAVGQHNSNTIVMGNTFDKPAIVDGVLYFKDNPFTRSIRNQFPKLFPIDERSTITIEKQVKKETIKDDTYTIGGIKDIELDESTPYVRVDSGIMTLPFMFYNYLLGANNKILGSIRYQENAHRIQGTLALLALSYTALKLKHANWWFETKSTQDILARTVDHSGLFAIYGDLAYTGLEILANTGAIDADRAFIKPRYVNPNEDERLVDTLLTPFGAPASLLSDYARAAKQFMRGRPEEGTQQLIYSLPFAGLPYFKQDVREIARSVRF